MASVAVVHLVWGPLGPEPVHAFVEAYRRHPAGSDHRLVVAFNGVTTDARRRELEAPFAGLAYEAFVMPEPTQDIPVYIAAARRAAAAYVCCLNSYSTPLVDGWLAILADHACRPGIGLVGATGSWESAHTAGAVLRVRPPAAGAVSGGVGRLLWTARHARNVVRLATSFPAFPNPHVRSNTFMIGRDLLLRLRTGDLTTKRGAERFESGRRGMTRQVTARGLAVRVVGRDDLAYAPDEWPESRTFRSGAQENLLVADNRTRQYAEAAPDERRRLSALAWGEPR